MWDADLTGGVALVFGAEGKGCGRSCAGAATRSSRSRSPGRSSRSTSASPRRSSCTRPVASGERLMAEPTLYLFDGYNLLHAGALSADRRELVDVLASFVASKGARGIVVFDGVGDDERARAARGAVRPDADTLLERLAAEHRSPRAGAARVLGRDRARHRRARGCEPLVADVPARPRAGPPGTRPGRARRQARRRDAARLERLRRGEQ